MCEGHYDILTNERPRGDTVFLPADGPELDALVERVALRICFRRSEHNPTHACSLGCQLADGYSGNCPEAGRKYFREARAAIEALRGK